MLAFWSVALLNLGWLAAYRAAFFAGFRSTGPGAGRAELLKALGIGLRLDLRLALLLALPLLVLGWLPVVGASASAAAGTVWWALLLAAWFAVTLIYLVDVAHYSYLHCRLNATVVENIEVPSIALRTAWESFPLLRGALVFLAALAAYGWTCWAALGAARAAPDPAGAVWPWWLVTGLLVIAGLHGRATKFPLRWSDAFFSTSPFVAALGLNPVLFLQSTWPNRHARANPAALREHYSELAAVLGVAQPDTQTLDLTRRVPARPREPADGPRALVGAPGSATNSALGSAAGRPPNIVVIVLESHAGYKIGAFGNRLSPTPHFDALARDSLLFRNFFAFSSPTARAIFTLLTGIPDVNPVHSASRNPMVVKQHTLVNAFTGYDKMYFIGGSASWGNIRGVLSHNISDMELFEEKSFVAPAVDGWGVSDLHLLLEAGEAFSKRSRPFVAFLHTSGNHRPWTIPEDNRGFQLRDVPTPELHANGFDSLAEFNSFRFMDHSIGAFFEAAKRQDWYRNTIFFTIGDHGAAAPHDIPWERLGLTHVHTPMVIHAPALLGPAREIEAVASSLDVLPTAASLAGLPYENATLGRDIFEAGGERLAFVRAVPRLGLVSNEFFLCLQPSGSTALYRYRSEQPCDDVSSRYPSDAARLTRLCRGYLEASRFLLHGGRAAVRA
ncbi:MAG: LTA synthase family protein [Planctomycetota bacterium]